MAPLRLRRISVQCQNIKKQQHFMWGKTDTVFTIKSMIEKKTGTPSRQQVLTWQGAVAPLADDRPLSSYNLKDEANISMTVCDERLDTFPCFVKLPNGKTMTMHLVSDDSVLHIKEMIHTETGIPRAMMYITTGRYLLQDLRCLSDYNIGSASNMTVHLRLHGGSGAEWSTEELNTRIDELSNRVDEIGEVFVTDNYVDMKDLELHGRIDELTETLDSVADGTNYALEHTRKRLKEHDTEIVLLKEENERKAKTMGLILSGKHMSCMLSSSASSSSGGHDALAIAAIKASEDLAQIVHKGDERAQQVSSEVKKMKGVMDLFEAEQNETTEKQEMQSNSITQQANTITDLRHQVYSLTDTLHALMRRVDNMERNVRPRMGEAAPSQSFQDGSLGDRNGLLTEHQPPPGQPRRLLPPTFGDLGLRGGGQIFIKTLAGNTITIDDMNDSDSVDTLKTMIRLKLRLIFTQNADFYLIFHGRRLMNEATLGHYHITAGATVWMVLRLRGGMVAGPTFALQQNSAFL